MQQHARAEVPERRGECEAGDDGEHCLEARNALAICCVASKIESTLQVPITTTIATIT